MEKISLEKVEEEDISGYLPDVKGGFVRLNGYLLPENYLKYAEAILEFEVRSDDIFVVSFPKCGTTWSQEMVWCIKNSLDFVKAKSLTISQRYPFLELTAFMESMGVTTKINSLEQAKSSPSPRFIKSHMPPSLLPRGLLHSKAKTVYVARDPRDACLSFYHHHRLFFGYQEDSSAFVRRFISDNVLWTPYWKHVMEFWQIRDSPNILFITYEQMKKNIDQVIKRVARFLDAKINEEDVERLKAHLDFDNMKGNPAVNYEDLIKAMKGIKGLDSGGKFMRSGKCGGYAVDLNKDDVDILDAWFKKNLEENGLDVSDFLI